MDEYRMVGDYSGKDEIYLGRMQGYRKVYDLEQFKHIPEHLSAARADQVIGCFKEHFLAGKTGNRIEIWSRNKARKELTAFFKAVLHFLHCVATEADIPLIQEAGIVVRQLGQRKTKKAPVIATAGEVNG